MKTLIVDMKALLAEDRSICQESLQNVYLASKSNNIIILSDDSWRKIGKLFNKVDQKQFENVFVLTDGGSSCYRLWGKYGWVAQFQDKWASVPSRIINSLYEVFSLTRASRFDAEFYGTRPLPDSDISFNLCRRF